VSRAALTLALSAALAGCSSPRPVAGVPWEVIAQEPVRLDTLRTRAERSGYTETSRYAEVVAFLDALRVAHVGRLATARPFPCGDLLMGPYLCVTTFGRTAEGRALPLAVWGADTTAAAVRATGKTRVLVFANIHAGEVDGKEAVLALLRDLTRGAHAAWADSLVLLVAPIYNADGNERFSFDNRPLQLGPVGGMGQRPNAQGLDLNRDFLKADAPETRALLGVLRAYDPHVVLDLHTTDGTAMAYHLTYAPPLHPNTDAGLDAEAWARWLPDVTARVAADGWRTWHYGNVPGAFGEPAAAPRGWYSFDYRPRFSTNYAGLRNRFGFLAESYSYATFEDRIGASRAFVEAVVDYAYRHATRIRRLTEAADRAPVVGDSLAVRAAYAALPEPHAVLLGEVDTLRHPATGAPMLRMRDVVRPERMPAFVRFAPSERERVPTAYLVPAVAPGLLALLDRHGITYGPLLSPDDVHEPVETFSVDSVRVAERPFQGRRGHEVWGRWSPVMGSRSRAYHQVPLAQPLGRLAFQLLEPRSDDGVVAWGEPEAIALEARDVYPILRVP
jgi:hypothetical protein